MAGMVYPSSRLILLVAWLILVAGCARLPSVGKTHIRAKNLGEMQNYLSRNRPELDLFRLRGPFEVVVRENLEISLSGSEQVAADLYFAAHGGRAPLVILLHGYDATKEMHAQQAVHMASWGIHALTLQLPNTGPWIGNGRTLRGVVSAIQQGRVLADSRIDSKRIILAGHSFGAAAVAIALAEGAPAMGGILLDPASQLRSMPGYLGKIRVPLMIIGADDQYTSTTNRHYFFYYVRGDVSEISIKDAIHEDAQFPSDDYKTTEALQISFASALTAAALSLHMTGKFDYAWASFQPDLARGKLLFPRRK